MKFWLSCFFLLFVAAELFEWASRIGGFQPHDAWLVLGGMGLAAASNAAHLPGLFGAKSAEAIAPSQSASQSASQSVSQSVGRPTDRSIHQLADQPVESPPKNQSKEPEDAKNTEKKLVSQKAQPRSVAQQSQEDSISFKVRLPWR